jgi:hypothetical protein
MLERLERLQALRGVGVRDDPAGKAFHARVAAVKVWQQSRIERCYADLAADTRYAPAVAFFLEELYGSKDSAIRDRELVRMVPTMKKLLPKFAFETVERALELDELSEEFDQAIARVIAPSTITEATYVAAFRAVDRRQARLHQVALMRRVGEGLDVVVRKPLIYSALKMLRKPASLAGLGEMQQFLEAGFSAFRHMKGATYFLETVAARETALIARLLDGEAMPFAIIDQWVGSSQAA